MFFTQEDYRKIEKWLLANSVKDTEFAGAATPLKGNETVVLVQDGKNVKTSVKDIVDQFFLLGVSDFLNITDKYGESYISIDQAIQLIPAKARKEGQVITFLNTDGNWEIYQFIGKLNQWNNPTLWNNPLDWEKFIIDSILPDEEDLTKSLPDENGNSYLSLKDREYNPEDFSGLGRVILRKNIVEIDDPIYGRVTKNILFQDMIAQSNTIYEIRYDFDLNGNEIIIPARCTLDFQGGKIVDNGKVVFSNTKFDGILKLSDGFADSIVLEGTYEEGQVLMVEDRLKYWKDNKWNNVADDTNFTVKSTETLPAGQPAEVILTTVEDVTAFSFKIPRGLTGERGAPGINGDSVEYIFKLTSDAIPPERPTSIEQTTDFIPVGWTDNPVGVSAINNYEWVSVRKFRDDLWGEFSIPALWANFSEDGKSPYVGDNGNWWIWDYNQDKFIDSGDPSQGDNGNSPRINDSGYWEVWGDTGNGVMGWIPTGVKARGEDGKDSKSDEFIFIRNNNPDFGIADNTPTSIQQDDYVPTNWTDDPVGVDSDNKYEWVSTRKFRDEAWGAFSTPSIWNIYVEDGEDGKDSKSDEFIFKVNNDSAFNQAINRPYSNPDTDDYVPTGWSDDPTGATYSEKYEWVCKRIFRNGSWSEFSIPALWAKYGDNGQTGNSARTMYCKTASASNVPKVNANDINPGSIWGVTIPSYSGTEVIWGIQAIVAYDNTLVQNWQGPYLITGVNGKDGTPPNYKTYVFKLSDSKPSAPTSNDPDAPGGGWVDYPNQEGNWWQCVGTVNGVTGLVTEWGEVIPLNGRDGTAQDGKFTEFRFAKSSSDSAPSVVKSDRNPSGWTTSFPTISNTEILWMIKAVINPNNTLYSNWEGPIRISGEKGPQGNTGPAGKDGVNGSQGVSGIPGVDIELRYSLGTDTTYDATWNDTVKTTRNPTSYGWSLQMPTLTDSKLYIWLIQARIAHQVNGDAGTLETGSWSTPIKLNGTNGLPGPQGKKGQIVYPAGVYGNTVSYTTTETKAPYVYDPSDGNFYVLNAIMTWLGTEQSNKTPSQDFITNSGEYWLKFDAFEAIYAKIGIIANGLIGSVVFNGDYMFSQNGITPDGRDSTSYELFDPTNPSGGVFIPNICLNFKKGEGWLGNLNFSSRAGILSGQTLTLTKDRWAIDDPNLQYNNHDISADAMGIYFGGKLTQGGSSAIGLHATLGRTSKFTIISRHWLLATDTDMLDKLPIGTVYLDESDHTLKVKY